VARRRAASDHGIEAARASWSLVLAVEPRSPLREDAWLIKPRPRQKASRTREAGAASMLR
jgi:hypothetical protein